MNISLGIHVGHDRGACIIKDGEVIAAIANERLDRIHKLIHAVSKNTINAYLTLIKPSKVMLDKINKLRIIAGNAVI